MHSPKLTYERADVSLETKQILSTSSSPALAIISHPHPHSNAPSSSLALTITSHSHPHSHYAPLPSLLLRIYTLILTTLPHPHLLSPLFLICTLILTLPHPHLPSPLLHIHTLILTALSNPHPKKFLTPYSTQISIF